MSYLALARKWRPQTFSEMVGQHHVLQALQNALLRDQVHHAYLFSGTRGVGKTTIARLIAKCLNCEQGMTPDPCGSCPSCLDISAGRYIDLLEIDAASNTKVEDTRILLENAKYRPSKGRYKIFLIDEVHMLSGHSFNALLKTLEEPPSQVKFLLATTDPEKLPVTILSRCLRFHLKPLSVEQISQHLEKILLQENIPYDLEALTLLAQAAQGSLRDALSLLDQTIAYGQGKVQQKDVKEMLGVIPHAPFAMILEGLKQNDANLLMQASEQIADQALNYDRVFEQCLHLFHELSIQQFAPGSQVSQHFPELDIAQYASDFSPEMVQLYYQIILLGRRDLPFAPSPRIAFEMVLLRLLAFQPETFAPVELNLSKKDSIVSDVPAILAQEEKKKLKV